MRACRAVLRLDRDEAPNLVTLHPRCRDPAHMLIVIGGACLAGVDQKLVDRVERHINDPSGRPHAVAVNKGFDDLDALGAVELVHGENHASPYMRDQAFIFLNYAGFGSSFREKINRILRAVSAALRAASSSGVNWGLAP